MSRPYRVSIKIGRQLLLLLFSLILIIVCSFCYGRIFSVAQTPSFKLELPRIDPRINPKIDPQLIPGSIRLPNWDFDFGLRDWEKTGTAFDSQPTYGNNVIAARVIGNGTSYSMPLGGDYWKDTAFPIGYKKNYWIGTYENRPNANITRGRIQGDNPQGTLTSQPFTINTNYITFLIGGGNDINRLKIELLEETSPNSYQPVAGTAKTGRNNELFRRDWWDVRTLRGKKARIRIVDNASGRWGHINVDDIQFQDIEPPYAPPPAGADLPSLNAFKDGDVWRDLDFPLWGFADMHTHPMSHLGFGKKLMHGVPDIGSIIPAGTRNCNKRDEIATSIEQALGNCNATHGGKGLDNGCGNYLRAALVNQVDQVYDHRFGLPFGKEPFNAHGDHPHDGYPNFTHWPHFTGVTHQQMWVDWIKRTYDGGERVMVALAVNNHLLTEAVDGDNPKSDKASADLQITEITKFVNRHSDRTKPVGSLDNFMEIAYSPTDLRRIVRSNKLAVVLGIEIDNIGDFNYSTILPSEARTPDNERKVRDEIERLYRAGVRYIFPIHAVDNKFGGAAVYEDLFNIANRFSAVQPLPSEIGSTIPGTGFKIETAPDSSIRYQLKPHLETALMAGIRGAVEAVEGIPVPNPNIFRPVVPLKDVLRGERDYQVVKNYFLTPDPLAETYRLTPRGHRNQKGLTPIGEFAIQEIMRRGMMIDIDHMSEKSANRTLEIADAPIKYPINSGHNGIRGLDSSGSQSENTRSDAQLEKIFGLGGMLGVGFSKSSSTQFQRNYSLAVSKMAGIPAAIGTDINGLEPAPAPRFGKYANFYSGGGSADDRTRVRYVGVSSPGTGEPLTVLQTGNKKWNINTDGVAHYGLLPDFLQELKNVGLTSDDRTSFFMSANEFAQMWDKSLQASVRVP